MFITNLPEFGGDLGAVFFEAFRSSETDRLRMVSGYVGKEMVTQLRAELKKQKSVAVELVVGMAAKEGLTQASYENLMALNEELQKRAHLKHKRQGVFAFFSGDKAERSRGMHAKAYLFDRGARRQLIVGSSNFSFSGLNPAGNVEVNVIHTSEGIVNQFENFFETLHTRRMAVPLNLIKDFPIRGRALRVREEAFASLKKVKKPTDFKRYSFVDIDFARNIENQTRSNLNCCFGKGRWARATGIVRPRDWYEVELISPIDVATHPQYPRGEFLATTSDGYEFRAVTNGDYFKNLRSADDLKILGIWLKGCLEDAGVLSDDPQEIVTRDTFTDYGNSVLRIYRPSEGTAILHFPRSPSEL
jgi:hypothetical protein